MGSPCASTPLPNRDGFTKAPAAHPRGRAANYRFPSTGGGIGKLEDIMRIQSILVPAFFLSLAAISSAQPARVIAVDFSKVRGPHSTVWKECIGAGRANEGFARRL